MSNEFKASDFEPIPPVPLRGRVEEIIREDKKNPRRALLEKNSFGDEWLSPEVVRFLIDTYAEKSPVLGKLSWEYGKLPGSIWGEYRPAQRRLYVNKTKTKNQFKKQVETVLHEIQHWNQHVACSLEPTDRARSRYPDDPQRGAEFDFAVMCDRNSFQYGYWKSPHEVDARKFAADNLQSALQRAGSHAAGKIEVESLDEAWEEIMEELSEYESVTRLQIGRMLSDYDMNTSQNMQLAVKKLKTAGVVVK